MIEGIIEKQLSRILKIIMFLSISKKTIESLSESLDVNEKTIRSDIEYFNSEQCDNHIFIDELKCAKLEVHQEVNVFELCQSILKKSFNISVLCQIIKDEPTIKQISETNFISVTSVRRVIEKINSCFEENHLAMELVKQDNKRIKLIGDELLIREMATAMFSDVFSQEEYDEYKWLSEELVNYFNKCDLKMTQEVHKRLTLHMVVSIYRIRKGCLLSEEIISGACNDKFIQIFCENIEKNISFTSRLESKFRIKISKDYVEQLFHFSLESIGSKKILLKDSLNELEMDQYNKCLNFIQDFMKEMALSEDVQSQLLVQTFKMVNFPQRINAFQIDINSIFYERIKKNNSELIARFESCLEEHQFPESFIKYESYKSALFLSYFMLSDELMEVVEKSISEKSILILSEDDRRVEIMYKKMIIKKFPHLTNVICYSDLPPSEQQKAITQYDLVLSDKWITDVDYIRISNVPTMLFWQNFKKNIQK